MTSDVASTGKYEGMQAWGAGSRLVPQEFALLLGQLGAAKYLADKRIPESVINKDGGYRMHSG